MNPQSFSLLFAAFVLATLMVKMWLSTRHIRYVAQHRASVPEQFAQKIPLAAHQKAADYTIAKTQLKLVLLVVNAAVLIGFTLLGGLQWLSINLISFTGPGTGVMHSEFNHAPDQTTHFLQIWIQPNVANIPPSYEQKTIPAIAKEGSLKLIASPDGAGDSVVIHADAKLYAGLFDGDQQTQLALDPKRKAYVHLIKGDLEVNGEKLTTGDALMIEKEHQLHLTQGHQAEVLVFDLAP